ncbi:MAG TPA: TetR family transcriptional regulator [Mycobacteriales bacterium]|jgi:AcrR family transcriptional regulator|nr:TetR family transcriptional regulator [Mycobacteriales bacterium]
MEPAGKTRKGEQTRERILDAALDLFRTQGYAETTMRQIAQEAGVAVGNAYYYFASKDQLILAFYERNHHDHLRLLGSALEETKEFQERLRVLLRTKVDSAMPYRRLSTKLFTSAADPESPLSPFSPESAPLRAEAVALMGRVVDGSSLRVGKDLRADLPELLWLYEMGIVLYWVHDPSPECERTYALIDRTVPLVERLVSLAKLPVIRPIVRDLVSMLGELRPTGGGVGGPATKGAPAQRARN